MKKVIAVILAFTLICMSFSSCKLINTALGKKDKSGDGYKIQQSKYLFGLEETPDMGTGGAMDNKGTPTVVSDLAGALGVKSFRIFMHLTSVIQRAPDSDAVSLIPSRVKQFHDFINQLKAKGITNFDAVSHYYIYPYGYTGNPSGNAIPEYGTTDYTKFMAILENCYQLLSKEFPDIKYWEPGNETNSDRFIAKRGYDANASAVANADYIYTDTEKAQITTDLCYYANAGIQKNKQNQLTVLPGMVFNGLATQYFLEDIYTSIQGGTFPRASATKDTNNDDYFQVLNWHPYQFSASTQSWIDGNKALYAVAQKYGDDGKKVFFTELGVPDEVSEQIPVDSNGKVTWTGRQEDISTWLTGQFDAIKKQLPWVETVDIFRLFDWKVNVDPSLPADSDEFSFGLFTTPNNTVFGPLPKPSALALFKYFNGANADTSPLYKYALKMP